jgi:AraC-like DNA-binding protein
MDLPILTATALGYFDFGQSRGISRAELLAASGLREDQLADPDGYIPASRLLVLWRFFLEKFPSEPISLAAVEWLQARTGIVGKLVWLSRDLHHSIAQFERYGRLLDRDARVSLHERAEHLLVEILHNEEVMSFGLPIELMLAIAAKHALLVPGVRSYLRRVTFRHAPFYPVQPYREWFGVEVEFHAPHNALWFDPQIAHVRQPSADPELLRYVEAQAERMLASLPKDAPPFVQEVRGVLARELSLGACDQEHVAKRLAVSTRTLQRKLSACGETFQHLLDETRASMAQKLLKEQRATVIDTAFSLGYADVQSFYRAFKRWTGTTPQQWRGDPAPKSGPQP